jgi:putative membrane protein
VAASVAIPWIRIERPGAPEYVTVPVAAAIAFLLVGLPPAVVQDPSFARVFAAAAVAICAMILPGVSGSFLLKVLGMYEVTLGALRALDVAFVLVFCAGAAVGLGVFSRVLNWLLEHRHDLTMAALVGLMAGSLRALWPWQDAERTLRLPAPAEPVLPVLALAVGGFALVAFLTWWGQRRHRLDARPPPPPDAAA